MKDAIKTTMKSAFDRAGEAQALAARALPILDTPTPDDKPFDPPKGSFQADLENLINRHSIEGGSNTPDFVLACFLRQCLEAFDMATRRRDEHSK